MKHYSRTRIPFEPVSHDPELKKQVLLREGLLPGLGNLSHIVLAPGSRASEHIHAEGYEVFYCIRGKLRLTVNGEEVLLQAGECLVVEPREVHSIDDTFVETELLYFFLKER
jgi:quercetin dioxygenase-like cupin family protein